MSTVLAIIEIASSGLGPDSYPIAIAWQVLRGGLEQHRLIRPLPSWRSWQREAEAAHGITRQRLVDDGRPADIVATDLSRDLERATIFSDALGLDQAWLDQLFAAAPGRRGLSLRRYAELFPGVAPRTLEDAIARVAVPASLDKLIGDLRRRVAVAERYLTEMSRATPRR
jgi:hypothetical protein